MQRRQFLQTTVFTTAALNAARVTKASASERVRIGCVGGGGRALSLIRTFADDPETEIVMIADVDAERLAAGVHEAEQRQGQRPTSTGDFRHIIDDTTIDAVVIGTPDHWHAIPTILACQADKDVYVEKPDGHNLEEGRRMVLAMRKHKRIVQMGSQHRSTTRMQTALEYIRSGALGTCLAARAWESSRQGTIGRPADSDPPAGVDYDMWLGPAPQRPFNRNRFHGRWRWFYDYGTGDLGNDGVHRLDMAVAALSAASETQGDGPLGIPVSISAAGGKWYFDDAQEFPDTLQVSYTYPGRRPKLLTYEMRIWTPYAMEQESEGAAVFGDRGYVILGNNGWRAYGPRNTLVKEVAGDSHERPHVRNFVECVKTRQRPNCDLETIGHPASILCHAGNIAARVGRTLTLDPQTETFHGDNEANALRTRPEYRRPWTLPEV